MRQLPVLLLSVLLLAACGDDDGGPTAPSFPDVIGAYDADWEIVIVGFGSVSCPGSLTVSSQDEGAFSGSFVIEETEDCSQASGVVHGEVRTDGGINFAIELPGSDDASLAELLGCTEISADDQLNGRFSNGRITADADYVMDCPTEIGMQRIQVSFGVDAVRT